MVLSNEMVLTEQYANNSGSGRGVTRLAFRRSMKAANLPVFYA